MTLPGRWTCHSYHICMSFFSSDSLAGGCAQCQKRLWCGLPITPEVPVNPCERGFRTRLCTVSQPGSALGFLASERWDKPHGWVISLFSPASLYMSNTFIHMSLPHEIKICCSKPSGLTAGDLYFMTWWIFIEAVMTFISWCETTSGLTGGLVLRHSEVGVNWRRSRHDRSYCVCYLPLTHPCLSLAQRACMTLVIPVKTANVGLFYTLHSYPFIATEVQQSFGI